MYIYVCVYVCEYTFLYRIYYHGHISCSCRSILKNIYLMYITPLYT